MSAEIINIVNVTFGISAAATLAVLYAVWKFSIYWTKNTTKIETEHGLLSENVSHMAAHIDEIRKDLSYLKGSIDILQNNKGKSLMQSNSPIGLTDEGRRVAAEMNAEELISVNWEHIESALDIANLATAYDVQQYCIETASVEPTKFFDSQTLNKVKTYAYQHGMPLQLYLRLLGVIIRDRYFELHDVSVDEVDNTAPSRK